VDVQVGDVMISGYELCAGSFVKQRGRQLGVC